VVRIRYDAAAARAALAKLGVPSRNVGGMEVFSPQAEMGIVFASDDRVIATVGANFETLPLDAFSKALAAGKGELGNVPEMKKLIESVDVTQPLWAVVKVTDSYRMAPVVAPFETMTMVGRMKGAKMEIQIDGVGNDKQKVAAAVGQVNASLEVGIAGLRQAAMDAPFLSKVIAALESVKCVAEGEKATLNASLEGNTAMLGLPMIFGMRSVHREAPPAKEAQPAQVQPVPQ
jgi:hypothetical protein